MVYVYGNYVQIVYTHYHLAYDDVCMYLLLCMSSYHGCLAFALHILHMVLLLVNTYNVVMVYSYQTLVIDYGSLVLVKVFQIKLLLILIVFALSL